MIFYYKNEFEFGSIIIHHAITALTVHFEWNTTYIILELQVNTRSLKISVGLI